MTARLTGYLARQTCTAAPEPVCRIGAAVLGWCVAMFPQAAVAQAECALSLVLAIDSSSSVDAEESDLQLKGLARALASTPVREAVKRIGGLQVSAFEWSGRYQQVEIAPWTYLDDDPSVISFATRLHDHKRVHNEFPTALGYAVGHAALTLERAPKLCARRVIDVSGDGVNNEGFDAPIAYRHFPFDGVTVNGLVIAGEDPDPVGYYRSHVLHGPDAFLEVAESFGDYEEAMRRKLLREILGSAFSHHSPDPGRFASADFRN